MEDQVRKVVWRLNVERTEFLAKEFSFIQYILFAGWLIFLLQRRKLKLRGVT